MQVQRLGWLGTRTDRFMAMAAFYQDVLRLTPDEQDHDFAVFRLANGDAVELFGPDGPPREHFTTGPVAGFVVDDVAVACEELRAAGIELLGDLGAEGGTRWQHFRAPDGNVYELTELADPEGYAE